MVNMMWIHIYSNMFLLHHNTTILMSICNFIKTLIILVLLHHDLFFPTAIQYFRTIEVILFLSLTKIAKA